MRVCLFRAQQEVATWKSQCKRPRAMQRLNIPTSIKTYSHKKHSSQPECQKSRRSRNHLFPFIPSLFPTPPLSTSELNRTTSMEVWCPSHSPLPTHLISPHFTLKGLTSGPTQDPRRRSARARPSSRPEPPRPGRSVADEHVRRPVNLVLMPLGLVLFVLHHVWSHDIFLFPDKLEGLNVDTWGGLDRN